MDYLSIVMLYSKPYANRDFKKLLFIISSLRG